VRIRSSANWALLCALLMCATPIVVCLAFNGVSLLKPARAIHANLVANDRVPVHCFFWLSSEPVPPVVHPVVSPPLSSSKFAIESPPAAEPCYPAECEQNNITACDRVASMYGKTFSQTAENLLSWSLQTKRETVFLSS
jgi:hypothetical protein